MQFRKWAKQIVKAMQNKLHYAIHGQTPAEVIVDRANHQKDNMGLTHWENAPHGKIHKYDVSIAKNYGWGVGDDFNWFWQKAGLEINA